jgi:hypothetical protein
MARQPFEYGPECDGPDVDINIIPAAFPLCDEVLFEDPQVLPSCTDVETVDFIVPPVCPCFPARMGLTPGSNANIACGGPVPTIDFDAAIVNVSPDCCSPEFKLDVQLDIQVPCVGPVGGCDEITGQAEVLIQQGQNMGDATLFFRRCVDAQGNFINDPCCIRLEGLLSLPCPDIKYNIETDVVETAAVDILTIEEFTIEFGDNADRDDPLAPCEYDVNLRISVPLEDDSPPVVPPTDAGRERVHRTYNSG